MINARTNLLFWDLLVGPFFSFIEEGEGGLIFRFCFISDFRNESTKFVYSFFQHTIMQSSKTIILNARQIQQRIDRISYQIYENNYLEKEILIAGVEKNGYVIAERISEKLQSISLIKTALAKIVINKKDPLSEKIKVNVSKKDLKGKVVVVVDDVLESGKTMMYGIEPFLKHAVKRIATVVLVDRDHRSFPIKADFVGISLATTMQEHISVELNGGENDVVFLM
jgi:pyrimidine operon attenuation protein / uracil phosphoribosyltransferase